MAKNIYQIVAGPEQATLVASLLTKEGFVFDIDELGEFTCRISKLETEDGSGHSWNIKVYGNFPDMKEVLIKGYYNDKSQTGFIELSDEYVATRREAIATPADTEDTREQATNITLEDVDGEPKPQDLSEVDMDNDDTCGPTDDGEDCNDCGGCEGCEGPDCSEYDTCPDAGCPGCDGDDDEEEEDDDFEDIFHCCPNQLFDSYEETPPVVVNAEAGSNVSITFNFNF